MVFESKEAHNAYHRQYYQSKVDKDKRKKQFADYYKKNKAKITLRKKQLREEAKKAAQERQPE